MLLDWCRDLHGTDADLLAFHRAGDQAGIILACVGRLGSWSYSLVVRRGMALTAEFRDELVAEGALRMVLAAKKIVNESVASGAHIRCFLRKAATRGMVEIIDGRSLFGPSSSTRRKRRAAALKDDSVRPELDRRERDMPVVAADFIPWDGYHHSERWSQVPARLESWRAGQFEPMTDKCSSDDRLRIKHIADAALEIADGATRRAIQCILSGEAKSVAEAARLVGVNERTLRGRLNRLARPLWAEINGFSDKIDPRAAKYRKNTQVSLADSAVVPKEIGRGSVIPSPHFSAALRSRATSKRQMA